MNTENVPFILSHVWAVAESTLIEIIEARRSAWTVRELAELLNLGKRSVYDWIDAGKLPAIKMGSVTRLDPKTTAAWLRARLTTS
jgi:excisionase family DNA binding protein